MIAQMGQAVTQKSRLLDGAVEELAGRAFDFLERLVAEPSVVGEESGAQAVVADELGRLGFAVARVPITPAIEERPGSGVPLASYEGRDVVVGRRGSGERRSLLINGHVDVVPAAEAGLWSTAPFTPVRLADGWLAGRGAGDMKGGFAMALLAVEAALAVEPALADAPISFVSVLEEECTGNGTLAAAHAGVLADAVLLPECTALELLLDGIGIVWAEIEVRGRGAHARAPGESVNAIEAALPLLEALRGLEAELNRGGDVRCATNLGVMRGGDWRSSVPAAARLGVRVGFPRGVAPAEAQRRLVDAVGRAARADSWLSQQPPRVRFDGFRAEGYSLRRDHPLVAEVSRAHEAVFGEPPAIAVGNATTDARFYLNQFDVPALCYGPRAREIHGVDEAVELRSIVDGARVLARFLCDRFAEAG
jgi:acetylornithine deacetylase